MRQLPSGRWQARYRDLAGKPHAASQTFATRPEAARFLAQVETDLARGEWTDPRAGRVSFAAWAARWQETTTNLRPNTRALHGYLLRRFLLPAFADTALADLDLMAVRSWLAGLEREAVSSNTVAKAYRLLARIMDTAVEAGLIVRNPCSVKGAATERAPEMRVATVVQVAALAESIDPRFRALVLVAAYAGLRWGELVGLRVKRVDLLHGRITVAEQATEIDGQFTWGPPKTEAGRRTVTLPAMAAAALAEHLSTYGPTWPGWLGVHLSPEGRRARHRRILTAMTCHFSFSGRRAVRRPVAVAAVMVTLVLGGCGRQAPRPAPAIEPGRDGFAVLVFTRTTGFRHASIDDGVAAIRRLGAANGFTVDVTQDPKRIQDATLKGYRVVVFLSTTGEPLDPTQQAALKRWVEAGGGWLGVHAAADAFYDWPWYGELVGAWFQRHPSVQRATVQVTDRSHPSTGSLPAAWTRSDEWYDFRDNPRGRVQVLAVVDESSYQGGGMGADHPVIWCHQQGRGRSWYTALGHTKASWSDPLFLAHMLGGIRWAAGGD